MQAELPALVSVERIEASAQFLVGERGRLFPRHLAKLFKVESVTVGDGLSPGRLVVGLITAGDVAERGDADLLPGRLTPCLQIAVGAVQASLQGAHADACATSATLNWHGTYSTYPQILTTDEYGSLHIGQAAVDVAAGPPSHG